MSRIRLVTTSSVLIGVLCISTWGIVSALPLTTIAVPPAAENGAASRSKDAAAQDAPPNGLLAIRLEVAWRGARPQFTVGDGGMATLSIEPGQFGFLATVLDSKSVRVKVTSLGDAPQHLYEFDSVIGGPTVHTPTAPSFAIRVLSVALRVPSPSPPPLLPPAGADLKERMEFVAAARPEQAKAGGPGQGTIGVVPGSSRPGQLPPQTVPPPPPPPPPPPQDATADHVYRVGAGVRAPVKVKDVRPVYPEEARAAGVSGIVILETHIAKDGTVVDVRVLRSIPLLDAAALEAVRQWRFAPTLLNGEPIEVIMTVTVNFVTR
jgi:protein TonB